MGIISNLINRNKARKENYDWDEDLDRRKRLNNMMDDVYYQRERDEWDREIKENQRRYEARERRRAAAERRREDHARRMEDDRRRDEELRR